VKTYTYTNSLTGEVVFWINSQSITTADLAYETCHGVHPSKLCHIACTNTNLPVHHEKPVLPTCQS
jgi:hypothetical protein